MTTFTLRGSFKSNEVNKVFLLSTHQNVCVTQCSHRYAHQNSLGRPSPLEKTLSQQLHLFSLCGAQGHVGPRSYHNTSSRKAQPALVQLVNDLRLQHTDRFSSALLLPHPDAQEAKTASLSQCSLSSSPKRPYTTSIQRNWHFQHVLLLDCVGVLRFGGGFTWTLLLPWMWWWWDVSGWGSLVWVGAGESSMLCYRFWAWLQCRLHIRVGVKETRIYILCRWDRLRWVWPYFPWVLISYFQRARVEASAGLPKSYSTCRTRATQRVSWIERDWRIWRALQKPLRRQARDTILKAQCRQLM